MNYTKNYHLPQWEESDRVMRTDFNQMCADIDNGIKSAAQAAQTAQGKAEELPYVMGTYSGMGTEQSVTIQVGFRPSFVLIFSSQSHSSYHAVVGRFSAFSEAVSSSNRVKMTDTGFIVTPHNPDQQFPYINDRNNLYQYIAFK